MNKIFKVVWNRTIQSFVVTSELAKGRVKSSAEQNSTDVSAESGKNGIATVFRLTVISAALLGAGNSYAATAARGKIEFDAATSATAVSGATATGIGALSVGASANATANGAVAVGTSANATHNNSLAVGTNAKATQNHAVAMGADTSASSSHATAIGKSANAVSTDSTALGADSKANGTQATAVGKNALANNTSTTALGNSAQAFGIGSMALGQSSTSRGQDGIAIGSGSQAAANAQNAIAIGTNAVGYQSESIAIGSSAQAQTGNTIAIGKSAVANSPASGNAASSAIALGADANATGLGTIAIGRASEVLSQNSMNVNVTHNNIAIGNTARVGDSSSSKITQSIAIGSGNRVDPQGRPEGAWAKGDQSIAVGGNVLANGHSSVAIGGDDLDLVGGTRYSGNATDKFIKYNEKGAKTGEYTLSGKSLRDIYKEMTGDTMNYGSYGNTIAGQGSVALGVQSNSSADLSLAIGTKSQATAFGSVALGTGAKATLLNSVALGTASKTDKEGKAYVQREIMGVTYTWAGGQTTDAGDVVSVGSKGYERQIINVSPGDISATSTDAINGSQLYGVLSALERVRYFSVKSTDGSTDGTKNWNNDGAKGANSIAIGPSASTTSAATNGIAIGNQANVTGVNAVALGNGTTASVQDSVALGNGAVGAANNFDATAKNASFKNDSGAATNVSYAASSSSTTGAVSVGSAGNERQIQNVAAGRISATSTDAVNGSQLYTVMNNVGYNIQQNGTDKSRINNDGTVNYADGNLTTVAITDGENASKVQINVTQGSLSVDNNGTVSAPTAGVATAGDVANAINNAKTTTKVEAGSNAHVNKTTSGKETTYTVSADKATVQVSNALNLTSNTTTAADGAVTTDYSIDLAQDTKDDIQKGVDAKTTVDTKGLTFNGDSGSTNIEKLGSTVTVAGDDNITTEARDDKVTVKLNKDLVVDSVKAGDTTVNNDGVKIAGGPSLTKSGIDAAGNKVTNVADGDLNADSKDAVNGSQLFATNQNVANNAANIAKGINFGGTTGSNNYALGDTINVKGDSNIISETVAGGAQLKLADVLNVGQAAPVKIDGEKGEVSGLSNTTLGGSDFAQGKRAATEEQLNAAQDQLVNVLGGNAANNGGNISMTDIGGTGENNIHDAIKAVNATANLPLTFGGDSGKDVERKPGTKLNIVGGQTDAAKLSDGNIGVVANGSDKLEVKLAKDLAVDSVKAGDTTVNTDGVKVGDVNLTKAGLNNGGNKITNVAAGTDDTDAVNVAQLNKAAAAAKTEVVQGDNIVVTQNVGANGQTIYKVATDKNLKVDSVTAGDTVMNNDGVKVGDDVALNKDGLKAGDVNLTKAGLNNGGNKITNVAAGTDDTDAVNVSQLKQAAAASKTEVVQGKNIVVTQKTGDKGQTVYEVATDKDLDVDSVKAGDTTVNNDGVKVGDDVALTKDGVKAGDVKLTKDGLNNAGNKVTNVADGDLNANSKDAVNGSQLYATNQNVANNAATIAKGINFGGTTGSNNYALGDTINVKGDSNIISETVAGGAQLKLADEISVKTVNADTFKAGDTVMNNDGVKVGDKVALNKDGLTAGNTVVNNDGVTIAAPTESNPNNQVKLSPVGLNNGGQRITNVAPGKDGTDAANVNQLIGLGTELQNNINQVGKKAYAGVAGAIAQGSIPQVTRPGATGIGVGSGYYGGQSAMAIGVSAMSDGGNWIVKGNFSANTDGHVGVGAGALYQW